MTEARRVLQRAAGALVTFGLERTRLPAAAGQRRKSLVPAGPSGRHRDGGAGVAPDPLASQRPGRLHSETRAGERASPEAPLPSGLAARGTRVYDKSRLLELFERRAALRRGNFTLASGKQASYFLDAKRVTLDSQGAVLVGEGILELLGSNLPRAVGGLAIGADPITSAVVTMAGVRGVELLGFLVRKEAKGHGTQQFIEGPVQPGDHVAIVEDVVTTGGSSLLAIERAEQFGLVVEQVIAIVDRLEGGAACFQQRGYRFASLLTVRDFGLEPPPT